MDKKKKNQKEKNALKTLSLKILNKIVSSRKNCNKSSEPEDLNKIASFQNETWKGMVDRRKVKKTDKLETSLINCIKAFRI